MGLFDVSAAAVELLSQVVDHLHRIKTGWHVPVGRDSGTAFATRIMYTERARH